VKKRLLYTVLILIGLLIGLAISFPLKTIILRLFTENNVQFKEIKGNSFNVVIKGIEKDNLHIPELTIKNVYFLQEILLDNQNKVIVKPIQKTAHIQLKNFVSEKYLKNGSVKFDIDKADINLYLIDRYLVMNGKGNIKLKGIEGFDIGSINIDVKLQDNKEEKFTSLEANINGNMVKGTFTGKLIIDLKDKNNSYIEGKFVGKFLKQPIEKEIKYPLKNIF